MTLLVVLLIVLLGTSVIANIVQRALAVRREEEFRDAAESYMSEHPDLHCHQCTEGGSGVEWYDQCELHSVLYPDG